MAGQRSADAEPRPALRFSGARRSCHGPGALEQHFSACIGRCGLINCGLEDFVRSCVRGAARGSCLMPPHRSPSGAEGGVEMVLLRPGRWRESAHALHHLPHGYRWPPHGSLPSRVPQDGRRAGDSKRSRPVVTVLVGTSSRTVSHGPRCSSSGSLSSRGRAGVRREIARASASVRSNRRRLTAGEVTKLRHQLGLTERHHTGDSMKLALARLLGLSDS